jgi:hypothetical protein
MTLQLDRKGRLVSKRNKYGVSPREDRTHDGIVFASKREATRYRELRLLEKCGEIISLEMQPKFPFPMGFSYIADFSYKEHFLTNIGRSGGYRGPIIEDVKGVETAVFKIKLKCMKYFYPDVELRVIR